MRAGGPSTHDAHASESAAAIVVGVRRMRVIGRFRGYTVLVRSIATLFVVAIVACSSNGSSPGAPDGGANGDDASTVPLGQNETGDGTYYAATGAGACSFDPSPNDLDVAAMDAPLWAGSAPCGECVAITGPKGMVTVRIVDLCPECKAGDLDLSQEAFAKIADVSAGRVKITWHGVPCAVTGNVAYRFKEGSSQWWTAIQVRNHKLPIAKLEWQSGGSWQEIPRESYNYFVVASGVGTTGSFQVRVTAIDGQTLTDTLPGVQAGQTVSGAAQFQ
jgi:expansin (peptidoglycan-binding protein)